VTVLGYFIPQFPTLSETFILREYLMLGRLQVGLAPAAYQPTLEAQVQPAAARVARDFHYLRWQSPLNHGWTTLRRALVQPEALPRVPADRRGEVCLLAAHWQRRGVTHVHAQFGNAAADVPLHAAQLLGVPASLTLHAQDIFLSPPDELRRRLGMVRFATTCTQFNVDYLRRIAPEARIELLPYGLEAAEPGAEPLLAFDQPLPAVQRDAALVLAVGRLVANKGVDTLLRALALLPATTHAVIVGDGPERAALTALADELGLAGRVIFTGALPLAEIRAWYRRAGIFAAPCRVLPNTDSDGFPNVIIEALASEVPVVTTPIRGFGEYLRDGDNAVLIPPDDPAALARALAALQADPDRRASLAAAARQTVRTHFDLRTNTARLLAWIMAA